jgi:hypothetical protein
VGNLKPLFDERNIPNLEGGIGRGPRGERYGVGRREIWYLGWVGLGGEDRIKKRRGGKALGGPRSATWEIFN